MSRCPWYITAHAVRQYLALVGRQVVDDGPIFDQAEEELMQIAIETLASERVPRHTGQHTLQYRGPRRPGRADRCQLIVRNEVRPEGPLPQLVDVVPAHAGARR